MNGKVNGQFVFLMQESGMDTTAAILKELEEARASLDRFISDEAALKAIASAATLLTGTLRKGHKIISCGNGGSMCDAMHFAEELTGRFRENRRPVAALAISDPGYLSCVANDFGYEEIFSRFIDGVGNPGDILLAISTSGNSQNILNAIASAKAKGMKVIGLTGKNGGRMEGRCDVEIRAPFSEYADRAQEIHIKVIHILISLVEGELAGK